MLRSLRRAHRLPEAGARLLYSIAAARKRNWFVRQQAICGLGWFAQQRSVRTLALALQREWDDQVKRAIAAQSFLLDPSFESEWLAEIARTEPVTVARMANFMLALRTDADLAIRHVRRFATPNEVFLVDNVWRLYQVRRNPTQQVQNALAATLAKLDRLRSNPNVRVHLNALRAQPTRAGGVTARAR